MKKIRNIVLVLTIIAFVIISGFINIMAGYAFCKLMNLTNQENIDLFNSMGHCLLLSSFFLFIATVSAILKKVWLTLIFNIIGSSFYIYTVSALYSIPNSAYSKIVTESLAERHFLTIIVTLLLLTITVLNYFDEKNINKRLKKVSQKSNESERQLTEQEKIL